MTAWVEQGLAAAIAVILLLGVFQLGRGGRSSETASSSTTTTVAPSGDAGTAAITPTTTATPPTTARVMPVTTAPVAPRTTTALRGTARSVGFEGALALDRLALADDGEVVVRGEVVDAGGRSLGRGSLTAGGAGTTVDAPGMAYEGAWVAQRGVVRLQGPGRIENGRNLTISAPRLSFRADPGSQGQPTSLRSPVTVRNVVIGAEVKADGSRLTRPPAELRLNEGTLRATLSWAGQGTIDAPGHPTFTGQWLGVKARKLTATVRTADLTVSGDGTVQQVYVDGSPRIAATSVAVDLVAPPVPVPAGTRGSFTWAPRNRSDVDMAMTRIAPVNAQARWVNLALEPLPPMYGGESRPPRGGDTTGLAKGGTAFFGPGEAIPITCVILPRTADQRTITFDIPSGTPPGRYQIVLRVEGNFAPVTVTIPFEVRAGQ